MSFAHTTRIRVRYGETDQMGFVYYGVYALYYEVGRVEALRSLGILYAELEKKHQVLMPVVNMQVRYLRPARYDDELIVQTSVGSLPQRDIKFRYEIRNTAGELLNNATVQLCFLDAQTQKRIDAPDVVVQALKAYF